jgi:hypothetical protein
MIQQVIGIQGLKVLVVNGGVVGRVEDSVVQYEVAEHVALAFVILFAPNIEICNRLVVAILDVENLLLEIIDITSVLPLSSCIEIWYRRLMSSAIHVY